MGPGAAGVVRAWGRPGQYGLGLPPLLGAWRPPGLRAIAAAMGPGGDRRVAWVGPMGGVYIGLGIYIALGTYDSYRPSTC